MENRSFETKDLQKRKCLLIFKHFNVSFIVNVKIYYAWFLEFVYYFIVKVLKNLRKQ